MNELDLIVVGSANMDLMFSSDRIPVPGETILGRQFVTAPGGKGANQSVAAARLGAKIGFVGSVGDDQYGNELKFRLQEFGVDISHLNVEKATSTGVAVIIVDSQAQNSIVVVPGANGLVSKQQVETALAQVKTRVVLAQLEVPLEAVKACVAAEFFVLNPAPSQTLPEELLSQVDVITPNETETESITGIHVSDPGSCALASRWFLERGVKTVVLTLGGQGCYVATQTASSLFAPPSVMPIDTTAGGDAFSGALAYFISCGREIWNAAPLANHVAALATTRRGAQESMPTLNEMKKFAPELF